MSGFHVLSVLSRLVFSDIGMVWLGRVATKLNTHIVPQLLLSLSAVGDCSCKIKSILTGTTWLTLTDKYSQVDGSHGASAYSVYEESIHIVLWSL